MAKKKSEEKQIKPIERWRGRWNYPKDFPEEYFDLLNERYDATEKWEKREGNRDRHSTSSSVPMSIMLRTP